MLAGIARCPECGAAMTRVTKGTGSKGGRPKLVCTRAKAGAAPHPYRAVDLEAVHAALRASGEGLVADVPAGDRAPDLDREARAIAAEIAAAEDRLAGLSAQLDQAPSLTLSRHLRTCEGSLADLRAELERVELARATVDLGVLNGRLRALSDAFERGESVAAINAALRGVFASAVVDHRAGELRMEWRQGGETTIRFAWPE